MDSGAAEKKPVRVIIFHQPYTVLTAGDPRETEELAQTVDELMTSIAGKAVNADSARVAVLACLHMADRLRTLEREMKRMSDVLGSVVP
ncbi:MAG: cell division protein ZapA [Bryobacteraceae bacterium]|nr:cell division protein ZapA [Bryobacteraceae bacterium]